MFSIKTNTASDIEFLRTGANKHARTANAQTPSVSTPARVSSAAANSYLCQVLFRLFFDLILVHLQKVLFTADEAHRASHPSEARARTYRSKPIQKLPPPLGSLPALAPLPQQRRSDGLIPLTWATNARSDIATTSDRHEEGVYASVRSRNSPRWLCPQRSRR